MIAKLPLLRLTSDQLKETVLVLTAIANNENEYWLVISALEALMRVNSAEVDQVMIGIISSRWSSPEGMVDGVVVGFADICVELARRNKIKARELTPVLLVLLENAESWQQIAAVAKAFQQIATSSDHNVIAALQKVRAKIQMDIKSSEKMQSPLSRMLLKFLVHRPPSALSLFSHSFVH